MATTRREFVKAGLVVGAGVTVGPRAAMAMGGDRAAMEAGIQDAAVADGAFTRGVGVYPGAPEEFFGPAMVADTSGAYRNLALRRAAWASSSYDFNLTAQLVTDGIAETGMPLWISTSVNGQVLNKQEREVLTSHSPTLTVDLPGSAGVVELELGGGGELPEVDRIGLFLVVPQRVAPAALRFVVSVSDDGHVWTKAGEGTGSAPVSLADYPPELVHGAQVMMPMIALDGLRRSRRYRVELTAAVSEETAGPVFRLGQVMFYRGERRVQIGGPYSFTSAWKSAGADEEWVCVDLGGRFRFDLVKLLWVARAAEGKLQVSDDREAWRDVAPLGVGEGVVEELRLGAAVEARYVRALMTRPATGHGYVLSEMEVWGRGGFAARPHGAAGIVDGRLVLSGGGWRLQRGPQVLEAGEAVATSGYKDADWVVATVPGTALVSFLNAGAIPDPNFGANQLEVSDSYFYADFWYRTEFQAPSARLGERQWLCLDGVNWKAEVFLNGARLGRMEGAFLRGRFDVTGVVKAGAGNALAVRVIKNDTPASCKQKTLEVPSKNGGGLGADNPTFHASVGWDWIPTIRGRNTGIWAEVRLETTAAVTLHDPLVTSVVAADGGRAEVTVEVFAANAGSGAFSGVLRGRLGEMTLPEQRVELAAGERRAVRFTALAVEKPNLWWPVGYGDPQLYNVELRMEGRGGVLDRLKFQAGIRQMTAREEGGALRMYINGRRFIPKGGNWGFGESMLRYRAREYDAAVRYHREMHFNMIRDWVGQIGDEPFYEACDRHGLVVWQDFWLANPWDGPVPENDPMFLANARDYVSRIRRHACLGLYCGRNEGFPPAVLETGIRKILEELHPDIHYIGSSADGPVSGHGPYRALAVAEYFRLADAKLHSEIGAPAIPPLPSVQAMMPQAALWPMGLDWGLHDFTLAGAQGGEAFRTLVASEYGGATNAADWAAVGEIVSYEAYRAIFESQSVHRMGVLLWMSHPCWPSFVWQTYDYYLAPGSAYFACKTGAEPLHIQWNPVADAVEVVNYSAGAVENLTAELEIFDLAGKSLGRQTGPVARSAEDSTVLVFPIRFPASTGGVAPAAEGVQMMRLRLVQGAVERSTNFYLRGVEAGDYSAIRALAKATVTAQTTSERRADRWFLRTVIKNTSAVPALYVRLEAVRARTGDRVLPAVYEDGYFALLPGESRTLSTEVREADTRGEPVKLLVKGFNVNG